MKYISTRSTAEPLSFSDVLLTGLAPDGGLYIPTTWPQFDADEIRGFAARSYADVACEIMYPFVSDDIDHQTLLTLCRNAYARFTHKAVVPLVQVDNATWIMELFHGPTLAFKDVALQVLGRLFDLVLTQRHQRLTIVGATSGDTGGAAIEALKGRDHIDVFILHPEGRISDVQRRIMTCVPDNNIHNIAVKGSFDECQRLVKDMFTHDSFRKTVNLGAINSINWARIMAQIVYYFTTAVALGAPDRDVCFVVPTGNFGDIFAGFAAMKMGLPIKKLCIASNQNDILNRTLRSGEYIPLAVTQTISPSMDIQVSSNFERLLFEASGRKPATVDAMMSSLRQNGSFAVPPSILDTITETFVSARADETETEGMIKTVLENSGEIIDPHTAVGFVAAQKLRAHNTLDGTAVILATAHPAKFPQAVSKACGLYPDLPKSHDGLFSRKEYFDVLADDQPEIERYILDRTRVKSP